MSVLGMGFVKTPASVCAVWGARGRACARAMQLPWPLRGFFSINILLFDFGLRVEFA
jgi:hypothetical protein